MFANLLSALFGSRKPTDLAHAAQPHWDEWLAPISPASPVGADPGYDDDFLAIREEVAKLSDIDDALILSAAGRLLKSSAKDARVAVYYVYARMRQDGADGVADGFELLSALIDRFGQTLLPARGASRRAALEWLCGSTFTDRLERVEGLNGPLLERTLSALALITERVEAWPEDVRPALEPLLRRFEGRVETPAASSRDASPDGMASSPAALPAASGVASVRELLDHARQMALFLRNQPQGYLAAYRLIRCVRWDTIDEVPPHEASGKTRLLAPRAELRASLRRLVLQKQWPELLERVEDAFAESANHFWLDLQYYAFIAQEQAGGNHALARETAVTDCALMLERLPGLERLAFSDGSPFADDTTLEWIARHATVHDIERGEAASPVSLDAASTDWAEMQAQASDLAVQQGLEAALAWLQRLPAPNGEVPGARAQFLKRLVMARVAEQAQRPDTALHLLGTLDADLREFRLARWEPALAFEARQHQLRLLKIRATRKDADKTTLAAAIETLTAELTAIDPARAVALN